MPRPNPTQTRQLDNITLRRELKAMLPTDRILDPDEMREIQDLSNTGHRLTALRLRLIRHALGNLPPGMMLTNQQRDALIAFRFGDGPRPDFTLYVNPDGHFGQHVLDPSDPDAAKPAEPGPQQDPSEPGRYVQPSGRFALPGADGWAADTR